MPAGRRPTPTRLKMLKGNPGHRPLPKHEPQPVAGRPALPRGLGKAARRMWREISGHLDELGMLTEVDGRALELLCDAYQEWRDCRDVIEREGRTYSAITETGSVIIRPRPEVLQASDAWKRVRSMLIEFGLTPAARAKVTGGKPVAEVDPYEEFLQARA